MKLYDAHGKAIVTRTPDGWDERINIHEPGRLIVINRKHMTRIYTVGPHGEWRRRKDLETTYNETARRERAQQAGHSALASPKDRDMADHAHASM